jgi:hypothetical protein
MLKNRKSFLNKLIIAKDEFVSMKLHFRYHSYLYSKIDDGCKYCQDRSINGNSGSVANEDEKGDSSKEYYSNANKK